MPGSLKGNPPGGVRDRRHEHGADQVSLRRQGHEPRPDIAAMRATPQDLLTPVVVGELRPNRITGPSPSSGSGQGFERGGLSPPWSMDSRRRHLFCPCPSARPGCEALPPRRRDRLDPLSLVRLRLWSLGWIVKILAPFAPALRSSTPTTDLPNRAIQTQAEYHGGVADLGHGQAMLHQVQVRREAGAVKEASRRCRPGGKPMAARANFCATYRSSLLQLVETSMRTPPAAG